MGHRSRSVIALAILMAAFAGAAGAQTGRPHLGPRLLYDFDVEEFGLGGQLSLPLGSRLEFYPSVNYYFVDPGSLWDLNADLKYRFSGRSLNWLYAGGGLNLSTGSGGGNSETDAGLNLLAGWESLRGRVHPFLETRLILGDGSRFQIGFGLNFTLGGH